MLSQPLVLDIEPGDIADLQSIMGKILCVSSSSIDTVTTHFACVTVSEL